MAIDPSPVSSTRASKPLRVLYLAGPGDAPAVLRTMAAGNEFRDTAHVAYSGMVFDACRRLSAELLSISTASRADDFSFAGLRALNIADPLAGKSGIAYHMAEMEFANILRKYARDFRANVVITGPDPYPFLMQGLADDGVSLLIAIHAVLFPEFKQPTFGQRLAAKLSKKFYADKCTAILTHPGATVRQIHEVTNGRTRPIVEFLPLLRADAFAGVTPPDPDASVFRLMTVGRVEADKGAFAIVEMAKRVRDQLGTAARFDVCGTGGALEEARRRVVSQGLQDTITFHGWTKMEDMTRLWGESHLAVVPTTSDFVEGFNQVVIEAALAGRPVVTSRVCPALDYVRPCSIEVEVDDIAAYTNTIVDLAKNRARYRQLQANTAPVVAQFLDPKNSFRAAVEEALSAIAEGREVQSKATPPAVK